jgi:phage terminase large subunit
MDFGYSNDPSSLVSIYIWGNNMYVKEHLYRTQMTTNDIASFLRNEKLESNPIYADSAEPRLIAELRRMGFNIFPSTKGKDSINAGIDLLKRYKLHVLKDSTNAIMEFRNYKWKEDKSGMLLNIPEDKNNHIIDPCRYAAYSILSKPNFGKYALH